MDKTTSCCKVGAFCRLFFAKELRRSWKGSMTETCRLAFSLYARLVLPVMFLLKAFTITYLFDSNMEQGTDGLYFLIDPVLQ